MLLLKAFKQQEGILMIEQMIKMVLLVKETFNKLYFASIKQNLLRVIAYWHYYDDKFTLKSHHMHNNSWHCKCEITVLQNIRRISTENKNYSKMLLQEEWVMLLQYASVFAKNNAINVDCHVFISPL